MKRGFLTAVCGAAIVVLGLAGCSSDSDSSEATSAETETTTSAAADVDVDVDEASGSTMVTIDGEDQGVEGTVVCTTAGGNVNIVIGKAATGITAVVSEGDEPSVSSVALGNVNDVTLAFQEGAPGGDATATKDDDTYKITGNASGADMSNPMGGMVTKPFEIEVTCP